MLQTLQHFHCPSLDTFQGINAFLVVRDPKLNTVLTSAEYRGMISSLLLLATLFLMQAGMALALLATWAHCWFMFNRAATNTSRIHFVFTVIQPLIPKPIALHGVIVAKVQDPALGLVKPHPVHLSPAIQLLYIPLKSLPLVAD